MICKEAVEAGVGEEVGFVPGLCALIAPHAAIATSARPQLQQTLGNIDIRALIEAAHNLLIAHDGFNFVLFGLWRSLFGR